MDPAALLGVCALLVAGRPAPSLPAGVVCPSAKVQAAPVNVETLGLLTDALRAPSAREGIARVTFAEAGNQGDSGLAAVVYAILNRLTDGRWGLSVDSVLNARGQFEPDRLGYAHRPCGQAAPDTLNPVQAKGPGPG